MSSVGGDLPHQTDPQWIQIVEDPALVNDGSVEPADWTLATVLDFVGTPPYATDSC